MISLILFGSIMNFGEIDESLLSPIPEVRVSALKVLMSNRIEANKRIGQIISLTKALDEDSVYFSCATLNRLKPNKEAAKALFDVLAANNQSPANRKVAGAGLRVHASNLLHFPRRP